MFDRKAYLKKYLKRWRKENPDWKRRNTKTKQKIILGVLVNWRYLP